MSKLFSFTQSIAMDLGDELDFWHSKDIKGRLLVAGG